MDEVAGGVKRPLAVADGEEEDLEAKRRRILAETRDIDADDDSEEEEDSDDDDDSEDDEDAELQRELERVRREREEKKKKEVRYGMRIKKLVRFTNISVGSRKGTGRAGRQRTRHRAGQPAAQQARLQHEAAMGRRRCLQEPGTGDREQGQEGVCQCECHRCSSCSILLLGANSNPQDLLRSDFHRRFMGKYVR